MAVARLTRCVFCGHWHPLALNKMAECVKCHSYLYTWKDRALLSLFKIDAEQDEDIEMVRKMDELGRPMRERMQGWKPETKDEDDGA